MDKDTFRFFEELAANNNRDWFMANKPRWEAIKAEFTELTADVIADLGKYDPSIANLDAKRCVYRIYRDLRFSHDKRPYKTHVAFFLAADIHRCGVPGYYLQIGQEDYGLEGNCNLGGGIFMPPRDTLAAIRQEIFYNTEEFLDIMHEKEYKRYYGDTFFTNKLLSRVPKGYPADWEYADLLKYTDYTVNHNVDPAKVTAPDFKDYIVKVFRAAIPLNRFIARATE